MTQIPLGGGAEFDLIRQFYRPEAGAMRLPEAVRVGSGDDCAVVRGEGIALSVDISVEGIHFLREWLEPEEIGRETLNGEDVTKYRVTAKDAGQSYTVFVWTTDDGIPLRVEGESAEGRFEMQLTDLQRGPQPVELFEVPAGIQLMAMPAQ